MAESPLWECPNCGKLRRCDPLASDDSGGEEVAIGPDCEECKEPMDYIEEDDARPSAGLTEQRRGNNATSKQKTA